MISKIKEKNRNCEDVGNKAEYLAKAHQLGYLIADGYILDESFFYGFMEDENFIKNELSYLAENRDELVRYINDKNFTDIQIEDLRDIFTELEQSIIVRTVSIDEDTFETSSAGMFYSSTRIDDFNEFIVALKNCYCSLYCDRHFDYLENHGYFTVSLKVSILIQKYISGELSGVGFTANPANNNHGEMLLSLGKCDCSDVVNGKHDVNVYTFDKEKNTVTTVSKKESIDECDVKKVFEFLHLIRKQFDFEADVEFAIQDGFIVVFQIRPITTLKRLNNADFHDVLCDDTYWPFTRDVLSPLDISLTKQQIKNSNEAIETDLPLMALAYTKLIASRLFIKNVFSEFGTEKLEKFVNKVDILQRNHQNIYYDEIRPLALKDYERVTTRMQKLSNLDAKTLSDEIFFAGEYKQRCTIMHNQAEFGWIYIMKNGCGESNFFLAFPELNDLSDSDFFALIYHKTFNSEYRYELFELAQTIRANVKLLEIFDTIGSDYILYNVLHKNNDIYEQFWREFVIFIEKYPLQIAGDWKKLHQPCHFSAPHTLIGKIRKLLRVNSVKFAITEIEKEKIQIYEKFTRNFDEDKKTIFDSCLQAAEKAFMSRDDHAYYLERAPHSYMNVVLSHVAETLLKHNVLNYKNEIAFLDLKEITDILENILNVKEVQEKIYSRKTIYRADSMVLLPAKYSIQNTENSVTPVENKTGISNMNIMAKGLLIRSVDELEFGNDYILYLNDDKYEIEDLLLVADSVTGLLIKKGNPLSHLSITARELGILIIYGITLDNVPSYTTICLNGETGHISVD